MERGRGRKWAGVGDFIRDSRGERREIGKRRQPLGCARDLRWGEASEGLRG